MSATEKQSIDHLEVAVDSGHGRAVTGFSDDEERHYTRTLLRKLDTRMLPMLALLFLCSFLDRTNIGNAKILGLQTDLKLDSAKYSNCLAIFFAFYIASEVPSNLLIKKVSPRIWLGILTAVWGVIGMAMGFVQNYSGLLIVRAFLGIAEGGLLPGIVLYLSMMYRRSETGFRLGLIYSAASLSGAFGGLLATGLYHIGNRGGQSGWRWILIIEGILTVVIGIAAIFILPATVDKARFLSSEERQVAQSRLLNDKPFHVDDSGNLAFDTEPFEWSKVAVAVFSIRTWLSALAYFAILTALYSFGLFIPTIVKDLGYTAVRAQLFSVPPYAVAALLTVAASYISDRYKVRGPIMLAFLPLSIIGYAIIANSHDKNTKYGALFLIAAGLYPSVPPVLVWLSSNYTHHYTRATAIGLQLAVANCGGFPASFVYEAKQAPQYHKAHTIIMSMLVAAWVLVLAKCLYLMTLNKRKAQGKMDQFKGCGDDRDPAFKYII